MKTVLKNHRLGSVYVKYLMVFQLVIRLIKSCKHILNNCTGIVHSGYLIIIIIVTAACRPINFPRCINLARYSYSLLVHRSVIGLMVEHLTFINEELSRKRKKVGMFSHGDIISFSTLWSFENKINTNSLATTMFVYVQMLLFKKQTSNIQYGFPVFASGVL